jgi:hypothetical protein
MVLQKTPAGQSPKPEVCWQRKIYKLKKTVIGLGLRLIHLIKLLFPGSFLLWDAPGGSGWASPTQDGMRKWSLKG